MVILIISFTLMVFSGISKAIMDTLQFHYDKSIFSGLDSKFWNPALSWVNKYSDINTLTPKKIWIMPYPVFLTDGWHLFQSIFIETLFSSFYLLIKSDYIVIMDCLPMLIILRGVFGLSFYIFYNHLLLKTN